MSLYVDIEKKLGSFCLQVKLEAGDETLALLGASGSGKSMTLKCIAGIEKPDRGRIVVDGEVLFDSQQKIDLPPQQRRAGLLFQNYALFPQMTVEQNIRAGARREKEQNKREAMVQTVLERFDLLPLRQRYPHQLSGGEQQRVALARLLVSAPRILLLDEPFSALDSHLRFRLEREVRQVLREFGKTAVLVSHDRSEVFRLAQRIAVLDDGQITAAGTKAEVFRAPRTRAGAVLTGCKNISAAQELEDGTLYATDWGLTLRAPQISPKTAAVGIRMHDIRAGGGENSCRCRVVEEIENPFSVVVMLQPVGGGQPIGWELEKALWETLRSDEVEVALPPEALLCLED
ncbi:MAG: sulfate/molybdate ABC transporter ATP-binding protein [Oscillospiraceae bacterium]|nr:sulfate/molybdate ABC transporter ATP-binding protein [Oscillospiraceae bacterium]